MKTRNPNGDRIAALSRQTGDPLAHVTGVIAGQYLMAADRSDGDEQQAAIFALSFAKEWLAIIAETDEPNKTEQENGLALQNLLAKSPSPASMDGPVYHAPLTRLLDAVAKGDHTNPNPTPSFGSLR